MTVYKITFDTEAWNYTGLGYKVSCSEGGIFIWHEYCRDQKEVDNLTGDICHCGCADFKEYTNTAGTWRQCPLCYLARENPRG